MRLATGNSCMLWQVGLLLALCGVAAAHLEQFMGMCILNAVMVDCVPDCQKICSSILITRNCVPMKCARGCVCRPGWVRKGTIEGECIRRSSCKRWIL